ncbi:MAG: putative nucleic acid-binding Zn-ribbon protein [Halobacteriales archaeon]
MNVERMASEESDERRTGVSLPADLGDWLDEEAGSRDVDRDQLLAELVSTFRAVAEDGEGAIDLPPGEPDRMPEAVEERFEDQQAEFVDLIEDVRRRVVQVKRETDAKAPADHDHEELREDLEATAERFDRLDEELATLRGTVEAIRDDLDAGFENYEEILEYLADETDRLDNQLEQVARVLVEVRSEVREREERVTRRAEVERLQRAANQHGVRSAVCEECGESVEIALLTRPACPHCASTFSKVTPKQRFFGSHVLETGRPPALEGRAADTGDVDAADEGDLERLAGDGTDAETATDTATSSESPDDFADWTNAAEKSADRDGDST